MIFFYEEQIHSLINTAKMPAVEQLLGCNIMLSHLASSDMRAAGVVRRSFAIIKFVSVCLTATPDSVTVKSPKRACVLKAAFCSKQGDCCVNLRAVFSQVCPGSFFLFFFANPDFKNDSSFSVLTQIVSFLLISWLPSPSVSVLWFRESSCYYSQQPVFSSVVDVHGVGLCWG